MRRRSTLRALAVLLVISPIAACGEGGYGLRLVFSPESLGPMADSIEVAVIAACSSQTAGAPAAGGTSAQVLRRGIAGRALGELPAGRRGVYARALSPTCTVVAAGCTDVDLEGGGSGTITVTLVSVATTPGCASGAVCQAGVCVAGDGAAVGVDGQVLDGGPRPDGPSEDGRDSSATMPDAPALDVPTSIDGSLPTQDVPLPLDVLPLMDVPSPGDAPDDAAAPGIDVATDAPPALDAPPFDSPRDAPATDLGPPDAGPRCGDRVVGAPEVCDDGDTLGNDCCSADCRMDLCTESETNNQFGTADVARVGMSETGGIEPRNDHDYWTFHVTTTSLVVVRTRDGSGGPCMQGIDPVITVFDSAQNVIDINDDESGVEFCSYLELLLGPGDYYVVVEEVNGGSIDRYTLIVTATPTLCSNGRLDGAERCDDGNLSPADCCDRCQSVCSEVEPNNTPASASALTTMAPATGALPAGDVDYFVFTVTAPTAVELITSSIGGGGCPGDTNVTLYDVDGLRIRAFDDDDGSGNCGRIDAYDPDDNDARFLPPGTYYVAVRATGAPVPGYSLTLRLQGHDEEEPNHSGFPMLGGGANGNNFGATVANNHGLITADANIRADGFPAGDEDTFAVRNTSASAVSVRFRTAGTADGSACTGINTMLHVRNGGGAVLASNDDAGGVLCSDLTYVIPAMTTVYAHVLESGDDAMLSSGPPMFSARYFLLIDFP